MLRALSSHSEYTFCYFFFTYSGFDVGERQSGIVLPTILQPSSPQIKQPNKISYIFCKLLMKLFLYQFCPHHVHLHFLLFPPIILPPVLWENKPEGILECFFHQSEVMEWNLKCCAEIQNSVPSSSLMPYPQEEF
jgi:hypothetical protein